MEALQILYRAVKKDRYKEPNQNPPSTMIQGQITIKTTPRGQIGVPGVPKRLLFNNINGFNQYLWCPCSVPMVSLRDTCGNATKRNTRYSHRLK